MKLQFTEVIGALLKDDIATGSKNVSRSDTVVGGKYVKQGALIEVGVSKDCFHSLFDNGTHIGVFLAIDHKAYAAKVKELVNKESDVDIFKSALYEIFSIVNTLQIQYAQNHDMYFPTTEIREISTIASSAINSNRSY